MTPEERNERAALRDARRIVVKVGTRVLVDVSGRPDPRRMKRLVREIAALREDGREVVLVTSGAIGAGMQALKLKRRPKALADLQMAAAVGQGRLMSLYQSYFAELGVLTGQVLLTYDDLRHRVRHLNARNTMLALLRRSIVPIVNENDTVAVDEIKVGDNDVLASLVTGLIGAEALVLLSTTDGLRSSPTGGERIPFLRAVTRTELSLAAGKGGELSTGGMSSKLQAAQTAVRLGGLAIIADGRRAGILTSVFEGKSYGTLIGSRTKPARTEPGRKRWIAFFNRPAGSVFIDAGAQEAIERRGRSLLPIGVQRADGQFARGATVNVLGPGGQLVARGLVEFGSEEIARIRGKKTGEVATLIPGASEEIIHRDNLVLLGGEDGR